ncbi:type II secretion system protein [Fusibacter sp. JL216-2]|uniref:type II secretion system protein n=1 Tax=Fusibacter sp. JL216-2 TaxID=3071453 RepID=UPI003D32604D
MKMIQFFRKKMNKKGFTLVELMIVIAVLGILAAIAVPRLTGVTDMARRQADESTAQAILTDVSAYVMGNAPTGTSGDYTVSTVTTAIYGAGGLPTAQSTNNAFVVTITTDPNVPNRYTVAVTLSSGTGASATQIVSISRVVENL